MDPSVWDHKLLVYVFSNFSSSVCGLEVLEYVESLVVFS